MVTVMYLKEKLEDFHKFKWYFARVETKIGKMGKTSFKSKNHQSEEVLEIVHTDLCGPIVVQSYTGEQIFIIFVDDYSRMVTVMYLREKSEAFQKFKWYLERV